MAHRQVAEELCRLRKREEEEIKVREKRKVRGGRMRNTTAGKEGMTQKVSVTSPVPVFSCRPPLALTICTLVRDAESKLKERN